MNVLLELRRIEEDRGGSIYALFGCESWIGINLIDIEIGASFRAENRKKLRNEA